MTPDEIAFELRERAAAVLVVLGFENPDDQDVLWRVAARLLAPIEMEARDA